MQRQWFPDANTVSAAYAWVLAPVLNKPTFQLQLGYSASGQDARELRFVLAYPAQPYGPGDPRFQTAGRYAPYYTPSGLVSHSVVTAIIVRPVPWGVVRLNASYGVQSVENAPFLYPAVSPFGMTVVQLGTYRRTFSPWTARARLEYSATPVVQVNITGDMARTAFYRNSTAAVEITYRFPDARPRRMKTN